MDLNVTDVSWSLYDTELDNITDVCTGRCTKEWKFRPGSKVISTYYVKVRVHVTVSCTLKAVFDVCLKLIRSHRNCCRSMFVLVG